MNKCFKIVGFVKNRRQNRLLHDIILTKGLPSYFKLWYGVRHLFGLIILIMRVYLVNKMRMSDLACARRREFRYIYKPENSSRTKRRVFVSHFSNDTKEFQWNSKKYSIDNDYLWNTAVNFDLFWFWEDWDSSFNTFTTCNWMYLVIVSMFEV